MRLNFEAKGEIKRLRQRGYSIPEISRALGISTSSVFRYVQGIRILSKYRKRWLYRRNASKIMSQRNWNIARARAEKINYNLTRNNLAIVGAMLYWGEGAKRDFTFSNTDPLMIKFFLEVLRRAFGVKNDDIKISLRLYEDLDKTGSIKFWSKVTGIKLGSSTSIDVLKGSKKGKLKYGMCRIRVRRPGLLLKEIFCIIELLAKYKKGPRSSMDRVPHS